MKAKLATIHITDDTHRGHVEGAHNGVRFRVPVGQDVQVNEGTLTALRDSGIKMNVIEPLPGEAADEGSSAASTEATDTAIRLGEGDGTAGAGNPQGDPATLSQVPDPRTDAAKEQLQTANADTSDKGTGVTTEQRGLATDTSSAQPAKRARSANSAASAKAPAKAGRKAKAAS